MSLPSLTAPGWALAGISGFVILIHIPVLIDPSKTAKQFNSDPGATRLIGFLLILLSLYDIKAAFQDDWMVYKFSLAWHVMGTLLYYSSGKLWRELVAPWFAISVILAVAMYFG